MPVCSCREARCRETRNLTSESVLGRYVNGASYRPVAGGKGIYVGLPESKAWRRIFPSVSLSNGFCRKNALGSNMPCSEVMFPG